MGCEFQSREVIINTRTQTPNGLSSKRHQFNMFGNHNNIQFNHRMAAMLTCVYHVIQGHAFFSSFPSIWPFFQSITVAKGVFRGILNAF